MVVCVSRDTSFRNGGEGKRDRRTFTKVVRNYKMITSPSFPGFSFKKVLYLFTNDVFLLFFSCREFVDYHPDLGMECSGYYSQQSGLFGTRWRGIRFEQARHKKDLIQGNTLYVKVNISTFLEK